MGVPEVESFSEAKILIWVLTAILGLVSASALWFLKRYFKEQDIETEAVKKRLHSHETKMEKLAEKIETSSNKVSIEVQAFKTSALDFQGKLIPGKTQRHGIRAEDLLHELARKNP